MNSDKKVKNAAILVANERKNHFDEILTLTTGIRAKLHGVSATLIDEVSAKIVDPPVPIKFIEEKGREEEYPLDPAYQNALAENNKQRGVAALDAMVLFGVELVDPLPPDETWLPKLKFLERRGMLDLSPYNLEDSFEKEFVFKRYVAVGSEDLSMIGGSISPDQVAQAEESFPSN